MNIIYIAYSCDPTKGSESKIGWEVPLESSKSHNVIVITKEMHKNSIQSYLAEHPQINIRFFFVDAPAFARKVFKGPMYSGQLNLWQKKAYNIAKEICSSEKIDIIHQITPIEFRSIGKYGRIKGIKFVCGPMGGGEYIPNGLRSYIGKHFLSEAFRKTVNQWYRLKYRITKELRYCDQILFANHETKEFLSGLLNESSKVLTETGVENELIKPEKYISNEKIIFLVAGRLVYRKGHALLLDALSYIPKEFNYECRVVGTGPEMEKLKRKCFEYGLSDRVVFAGKIPYSEMVKEYAKADALIMPSLRETTGSVLLEAMSSGIPVITMNRFGGNILVNENTGWFYDGRSKQEMIESLKNVLVHCIKEPQEMAIKGENAFEHVKKFTWKKKMSAYWSIYGECLGEEIW